MISGKAHLELTTSHRRKVAGYMVLVIAIASAPLFPVHALFLFPLAAMVLGLLVAPMMVALLLDIFLFPIGTPIFLTATPYLLFFLLLFYYVRSRIII